MGRVFFIGLAWWGSTAFAQHQQCPDGETCGLRSGINVNSSALPVEGTIRVPAPRVALPSPDKAAPRPEGPTAKARPLVLAPAYQNPEAFQGVGTSLQRVGIPGLFVAGQVIEAAGTVAQRDLQQRALASIEADGGFGAAGTSQDQADRLIQTRTKAFQAYLGNPNLKVDGLTNVSGMTSVKFGSSVSAVHGVRDGQAMSINGAQFIGGAPPPGSRSVGYFVPLETKEGGKFYTGSSKQTTFELNGKQYTMFFPPTATEAQMQRAVQNSRDALGRGLDAEAMSKAIGPQGIGDPEKALAASTQFIRQSEIQRLEAAAEKLRQEENVAETDGSGRNPIEMIEQAERLATAAAALRGKPNLTDEEFNKTLADAEKPPEGLQVSPPAGTPPPKS